MNEDQLHEPSTNADVNLTSSHNNTTSGRLDFEKYGPYVDSIKNLLVPSLERSVYEGMEVLVYNQKKNLPSSRFDQGSLSTIYGPTDSQGLGIVKGIIKPAFKYWIKDGLINCFINAVVINNRLNKICRDWEIIRYGRSISSYISELNIFNESDPFSQYIDGSKSLTHTSLESITLSNRQSYDITSSSSDDEYLESNESASTHEQNHLNIVYDSDSSVFVVSKAQENFEPHKAQKKESVREKKIVSSKSVEYPISQVKKPILRHDKGNDNSISTVSKPYSYQRADEPSEPCNCEDILRKSIKTNSSSSDFYLVEQLKHLEIAMQNTCFSFDDIFSQLDKRSTDNTCKLFGELREKYIDLKCKAEDHVGSMTNLFIDQAKISQSDLQDLARVPTSIEASKSERDDVESSSRFNSTFNEISNGNIDEVSQEVIRNSNLDKDPDVDNFINTLPTPSEFLEDILSSTKNDNYFVIREKQRLKECNSENSCDCSTSTESSQNITNDSTNISPDVKNYINDKGAEKTPGIKRKSSISNKDKIQVDNKKKDTNSIRFNDDVQYYEANSISTQAINNCNAKDLDSTSKSEYDILEKVRVLELLKTIFEENEAKICLCNAEEAEKEKYIAETSVEQTEDRNRIKDDSSSLNHVVSSPVNSGISLASKITRVIPTEDIKTEVSDKDENNFNHFYDLDETELTKRTSTPERKKEIESLLNKEEFGMQEFDQIKVQSYSSGNFSEILSEGKENNSLGSPKKELENLNEYFDVKKEIEDNKHNPASQEVQKVENLSMKHSKIPKSNKSNIKSNPGTNQEAPVENRQSYSSAVQKHDESFYIIDEIEEKNHNLDPGSEEDENLSGKMVEMLNVDRNQSVYNKKNSKDSTKPIKKHSSSSKREKSNHKCEFFYLVDEIEENNKTSTPERKREIESMLQKEDLNLQNVNIDKTKSYFSRNITEGLPEVRKKSSVSQRESIRVNNFITSGLNKNSKNSSVISNNLSNHTKKVSPISEALRAVSREKMNYQNTDTYSSSISLDDLTSICNCSSDSDTFHYRDFKIPLPPPNNQLIKNKKKPEKPNNRSRRCFNIRAFISAICRGLKNIFSRPILQKLKHSLKTHIFKLSKENKNISATYCGPKSCNNRMSNYNSIDVIQKSKPSHIVTDRKYFDHISKNLKKENINPSLHQQPKGSHAKYNTRVINEDTQGSEYTCCRDRNNVRDDWTNPRTIYSYQSMNVSSNSCDCDSAKKRLYHQKYMRRRPSEYSNCDARKLRKSSFTPRESYSGYYKNLAAKHLAEYLNFRIGNQEMSDSDEVHCKECLESTDSELKSILNRYLKSSRSRRKKSRRKKYKHVKKYFNN